MKRLAAITIAVVVTAFALLSGDPEPRPSAAPAAVESVAAPRPLPALPALLADESPDIPTTRRTTWTLSYRMRSTMGRTRSFATSGGT